MIARGTIAYETAIKRVAAYIQSAENALLMEHPGESLSAHEAVKTLSAAFNRSRHDVARDIMRARDAWRASRSKSV